MKSRLLAMVLSCAALFIGDARAQTDMRELQMIARAVAFVQGLPRGVIEVAIVDGPGADAVAGAMQGGVAAGGVTLLPRRVPLAQLAGSGARVIIVPEGQASSHEAIAQAARSLHAVTLSSDMGCVRGGHCVVGVAVTPRADIVISRAAAAASNVRFAQAFRVVFREI